MTAALVSGGWTPASAQADRAKLAAAFADVDRLFTDFATEQYVPGAAAVGACTTGSGFDFVENALVGSPYFFTYRINRLGPTSAP